ncbi:hypothetical protein [Methylotenera sp. L2L1]|uniref:hypothetical protein n=1 Tax=Methylotenera sp. L2L1 TaxID=1502770 RepID=UPI0005636A56|nr:hypothetical protein [Methylotenera sp. L2L1]
MSLKLELEFIDHSPFSFARLTWLGLTIFLAGVLLLFFTWQLYESKLNARNAAVLRLTDLNEKDHKAAQVTTVRKDIPLETKKQIKATVEALTIPWNELLVAVEKSDIQDVAILSLEPNRKKEQVILSGEAKNLQAVIDYINRLEEQVMLSKVYLQKHSVDEVSTSKRTRFTLIAQWNSAEVQ